MKKALIIAELKNGKIVKNGLEAGSKAKAIGLDCIAAVLGNGDGAEGIGEIGITEVIQYEYDTYSGESIATTISALVKEKGIDAIIMPNSWTGKDIAGRIAAALDGPVLTDLVELTLDGDRLVGKKPIYAGKAFVNYAVKKSPAVITLRANTFPVESNPSEAKVEKVKIDVSGAKAVLKEFKETQGSKMSLTEASIIIAGGRGVKSPDYFPKLQELADLVGGALGASRAAVDAGWIDHSHQVGQTGKTVSPTLYIAVGISGAIQHLAGMGSSKYIVAINKDKEAPIFKVATYGVVEDLFEFVPALKSEIEKSRG